MKRHFDGMTFNGMINSICILMWKTWELKKHGNCNVMGIPYQVIIWDEIFREIDKTYYRSLKITSLVWIEVCCSESNDKI